MDAAMQRLHDLGAIVDACGCETREEGIEAARVAGDITQDDAEMLVRFERCMRDFAAEFARSWLDERDRRLVPGIREQYTQPSPPLGES